MMDPDSDKDSNYSSYSSDCSDCSSYTYKMKNLRLTDDYSSSSSSSSSKSSSKYDSYNNNYSSSNYGSKKGHDLKIENPKYSDWHRHLTTGGNDSDKKSWSSYKQ